jgi:hypothetical protein
VRGEMRAKFAFFASNSKFRSKQNAHFQYSQYCPTLSLKHFPANTCKKSISITAGKGQYLRCSILYFLQLIGKGYNK